MGVSPLCSLYSIRVFKMVSSKESSVNKCFVCKGDSVPWEVSFRKTFRRFEDVQYGEWSSLLFDFFILQGKE